MNLDDARNGRMHADDDVVCSQRFNGFLDFDFLLVDVDVVLGLRRFADIFARNRSEYLSAFADLYGNRQLYLLQLTGQDDGFVGRYLGLMLSRSLLLLRVVDVFRRARRG